ncbi:MAG: esterase-like activity of phytase family protein, partial [Pseudomonadota bacterium]
IMGTAARAAVMGLGVAAMPLAATAAPIAFEFIGQVEIPSGTDVDGTTLGGISGIARDPAGGFRGVSDEPSDPRSYRFSIDLGDGSLDDGDVTVDGVVPLTEGDGSPITDGPDLEGIGFGPGGEAYIPSEQRSGNLTPEILIFDGDGANTGALPVDDKFLGDGATTGVGSNLGFESLTISPDGTTLYTANEDALAQDGPRASSTDGSLVRIVEYALGTGTATAEYAYEIDPIFVEGADPAIFETTGLVELLALDNEGSLLALERSFAIGAPGRGYGARLYNVDLSLATDVSGFDALNSASFTAAEKTLLLDLSTLGIVLDNVEGLTFGPVLPDGRRSLIVISDDNFSAFGPQATQVLAFAVNRVPLPAPALLLIGGLGLLVLRARR